MTPSQLSLAFFFQLFFILGICRLAGIGARRIGQPQVVGEMVAGVLMGPSLFGLFFPDLQQTIFPKDSLKILYVLAQLGVGLYMFLVGIEFESDLFRTRARAAASVSIAGMVAPFALGGVGVHESSNARARQVSRDCGVAIRFGHGRRQPASKGR